MRARLLATLPLLTIAATLLAQNLPDRPGIRVVPDKPAAEQASAPVAKTAASATSAQTTAGTVATTPIKNVFWQPNTLKQGSPMIVTVELTRPATRVSATFAGKTLSFFKGDDATVWHALAGDNLETKPGSYTLAVSATLAGGRVVRTSKAVDIAEGTFKTGDVQVPDDFVHPAPDQQRQIAKDEVMKARAYAHNTPQPLWSGDFAKPVPAAATESFGESRILNEERSSLHRGTDYPVKEGTTVVASNAGTVVLTKPLFYEGNCIIVDHGDRFFTIYMHLSKMDVTEGDRVSKGAKLGLSGSTGRVTGPHMHFGVRWNGAYLDPVQLLALTLPKTAAAEAAAPLSTLRTRARR